ncbi:hypothetical protein [Hymenobacter rubripertinctus]|uniref:Uncharacterized protein n=1 Tax=Hymenobacter rubripertinctus TaxID=2029981 RepID=A0A418QQZ2_9BACT|nr:hypothetical protein [Hymenobacter rubripertinctus]RIY07498.1 hypothetical protein D0T11_16270 [Hymenobacter rubripertinctus]
MNNEQLQRLLEQLDTAKNWEYPTGFDYLPKLRKLQLTVAVLQMETGLQLPVETGSAIQDAPFHSQVLLPGPDENSVNQVLRFSNFGELVALADEELIAPLLLATIVRLLANHGYVYVPEVVYNLEYTGKQVGIDPVLNWWQRFFEWM